MFMAEFDGSGPHCLSRLRAGFTFADRNLTVALHSAQRSDMASVKLLLLILVVMIVAGTIWADYRWRRWMDARKRRRNRENDDHVN